jgi:hypothetical protein
VHARQCRRLPINSLNTRLTGICSHSWRYLLGRGGAGISEGSCSGGADTAGLGCAGGAAGAGAVGDDLAAGMLAGTALPLVCMSAASPNRAHTLLS